MALRHNRHQTQSPEDRLLAAADKRQKLHDEGKLSSPAGLGKAVIMVSRDSEPGNSTYSKYEQTLIRDGHAFELEKELWQRGQEVNVIYGITAKRIRRQLRDRNVSDLYILGSGAVGAVRTAPNDEPFDALHVSSASDHLKRGVVEHRLYGEFMQPGAEDYHINLGQFAVSEVANATTSVGHYAFNPNDLLKDTAPKSDERTH
jgi:hypothetical protein